MELKPCSVIVFLNYQLLFFGSEVIARKLVVYRRHNELLLDIANIEERSKALVLLKK